MSDYTNSKGGIGAVYPVNSIATAHEHLEPLIGADDLVTRHLFGVPLVSQWKDPISGKMMQMTPEMVQSIIQGAVQQAELECKIDIFPVQHREKYPFDRNLYESYGYMVLNHRPVTSVEKLSITPSNAIDVYTLPATWIETANFAKGQINIVPMGGGFVTTGTQYSQSSPVGGALFMSIIGNRGWIPAYWQVEYTTGFPDGMMPRVINELIGTIAAMEILSMLAVTFARSSSHSLGIDGLSQSVSTPGPQIFKQRMDELEAKRKKLTSQIKATYGRKMFSSHV
jgi:hypothetical protein